MRPLLPVLRRCAVLAVVAGVVLGLTATAAAADADGGDQDGDPAGGQLRAVEVLPLRGGFLDPPVAAQIDDLVTEAEGRDAELVVVQLSSGGGVSVDLDELLGTVASSTVPVAVLVGPAGQGAEVRGAAALLWLSADVRALAPDATVGPVLPADLADDTPAARDHARVQLEAHVTDPRLVERLLHEPVDAADLAAEGVASLVVGGLEPLLVDLDGTSVEVAGGERDLRIRSDELEVRFHSLGLVRRLLHAATTAPFIYLLLVVGLGMLLFEVFQPGFGVAGVAGVVTAAIGAFGLTVLPVTWWAVALVVLGLLLYAVDTAIAGFGPVTALATILVAVGSANFYAHEVLALPWWLVAATTVTAAVFFVFVMTAVLRAQAGPEGVSVHDLVGRVGVVRSVLNPEGHVFVDGALWRARWTGDSRRARVGTPVRVHDVEGSVVLVEPFDADAVEPAPPTSR